MTGIDAVDARFADRVRMVRDFRGMTRSALAARARMEFHQVTVIEIPRSVSGKRRRVTVGEAVALCQALHVSLGVMLSDQPIDLHALTTRPRPNGDH